MVEHVVSYNNWCRITATNATRCGRRSSARLARHWTAHIDTTATTAEADVIGGHAKHVMVPFQGVVARIVTGPHEAHRQDSYLPMRYDTGRPRVVI